VEDNDLNYYSASVHSGIIDYACYVLTNGSVKCAGQNAYGYLGNDTTEASAAPVTVQGIAEPVVSVSTSQYHACALTTLGGAYCWGYNATGALGDGTYTSPRKTAQVVPGFA